MEWPWKKTRDQNHFVGIFVGKTPWGLQLANPTAYIGQCVEDASMFPPITVCNRYLNPLGQQVLFCSSGSFFQLVWMPCRLSVVCSIFGNECHMIFSPGEMVCCRNMHLPEPRYQFSSPVLNWVWGNIIDVIVGSILLWVGRLSHTVLHGQVCDDVYRIWDWILTEKFNLAAKSRRNLSAVIVVPDTLDNRGANPLSKDASLFLLFNYDVSFLWQF